MVGIVGAVLLVLAVSNMNARALGVVLAAVLLVAACASDEPEQAQAQVIAAAPTSIPTTAPVTAPTPSPEATPAPSTQPQATFGPVPTSTPQPTVAQAAEPTPTVGPAPTATAVPDTGNAADPAPASTVAPTPTSAGEVVETATPLPTPTAAGPDVSETTTTPVPETPTAAVVTTGEPPLECFDREVQVYRAFVEGVDELSFEGGRVYCSGAGTNAVSAAGSYRHSSGLVVQRNGDFILNAAGDAYIPYSGTLHFCLNGQPATAPVRADTVPSLLVVIDSEAQRQVAQGAVGPTAFTASGTQC